MQGTTLHVTSALRSLSPIVLFDRVYTNSAKVFITGTARHQHQHSMSDGVHFRMKASGFVYHTPHIWRSVFDVHKRLFAGWKPIVRDLEIRGGDQTYTTNTYSWKTGSCRLNLECLASFATMIHSDQRTVSHLSQDISSEDREVDCFLSGRASGPWLWFRSSVTPRLFSALP